jgi:hypothetical protein
MALSMLAVHQAAENLLTCVCQSLARLPAEVTGLAGCPCRTFVAPGEPAADGCDQSACGGLPDGEFPGQLTVHVVRSYITTRDAFPRYEPSSTNSVRDLKQCAMPPITAVDLMVTLYRCVPLPTDRGCPPTGEELSASAMQLHADMLAIQQAVLCCYAATDTTRRNGRRYTMGQSATLAPRGGCVGIQQQVTVALDDCVLCPPVGP